MASEALEKVKIEIRSLLLSSKEGVPLDKIRCDYEMLVMQRLPLRELGFKDVQSLMRAMPDVAYESNTSMGITYFAVSDDSTAHIQKLVENQMSKKKRKLPLRGGRGRGGSRGGYYVGRGGRPYGWRGGGHRGSYTSTPTNPRSHFVRARGSWGARGQVSRYTSSHSTDCHSRGDGEYKTWISKPAAYDQVSGEDKFKPAFRNVSGADRVDSVQSESRDRADKFQGDFRCNETSNSQSNGQKTGVCQDKDDQPQFAASTAKGKSIQRSSPTDNLNDLSDSESPAKKTSPLYNLKIGVSEGGQRVVQGIGSPLEVLKSRSNQGGHPDQNSQQHDLRITLNRRKQSDRENYDADINCWRSKSSSRENHEDEASRASKSSSRENHEAKASSRSPEDQETQQIRRVMKENKMEMRRNLPPRLMRQQQNVQGSYLHERQVLQPVHVSPSPPSHFSNENTVFSLEKNNWVPPEQGEQYLQTYYHFFSKRGEIPPHIDVIAGKIKTDKGYYGRLMYKDVYYYPLEIMETQEQARQNAARSFCIKNGIPLLHRKESASKSHPASSTPLKAPASQGTTPRRFDPRIAPVSPAQLPDLSMSSLLELEAGREQNIPEALEKIYKMLKPNGLWVANLASMYQATHGETLNLDFMSAARQWPEYFLLEQLAENRYTVYPVPDALNKTPSGNATINKAIENVKNLTMMQSVGTSLQVQFSFAYSAEDVYFQRVDVQDLIHQIDDTLNRLCPTLPPPDPSTITQNSLVAANYEGAWYRAEVRNMDAETVTVYFVDYGNRESIGFSDLRPVPLEQLIQNIPSLAIPCAFNRTKPGVWCQEVASILADLSEVEPVLTAFIQNYSDGQCIVDVYTPDERLVNDLLLLPLPEPMLLKSQLQNLMDQESLAPETIVPDHGEIAQHLPDHQTVAQHTPTIETITQHTPNFETINQHTPNSETISQHTPNFKTRIQTTPNHETLAQHTPNHETLAQQPPAQIETTTTKVVPTTSNSTLSTPIVSISSSPMSTPGGSKLFADDPDPLIVPDCETFIVYICRVMSESTVLLRIVDEDYSDRLDELELVISDHFYMWPVPRSVKHSNIYACMVLAGPEDVEEVECDDEGNQKLVDYNKYYRVRVLRDNGNGTCDCYLPDHGDYETVHLNQIREIDPQLNASLSYQAVMARLHGLDKINHDLRPTAVRLLIKFLTNGSTFHAVKKGTSAEKQSEMMGVDELVISRVRKIIGCMKDVQPEKVAKIYEDVYRATLNNVEEIIQNIPGYGYWRESLEVDLIDTSQEDSDNNINEFILSALQEIAKMQAQGVSVDNLFRDMFSSNTSQAGTDSESLPEGSDIASVTPLPQPLSTLGVLANNVSDAAKLSQVQDYVESLPAASQKPAPVKSIYTWATKSEPTSHSVSATSHVSANSLPPTFGDNSNLPKFWTYPLQKFVSLQIVRVESPSDFVAVPMEQKGALDKMEMAMTQYFSTHNVEPASSFSFDIVYVVKLNGVFCRTIYMGSLGDLVKVFFPDHHYYDTVSPADLRPLPHQFNTLPFLARKMRLGGVQPTGQEWPLEVVQWFQGTVSKKSLFALVLGSEDNQSNPGLPGTVVVRLIDTSGSEDLVIDEYMAAQGMGVLDSSIGCLK